MAIHIRKGRQIELARQAGHTAAKILVKVADLARPGITTGELDEAAAEFMKEEDCVSAFKGYRGFPGITCLSVNDQIVHGIGGPRELVDGDILKIDVGIVKEGWVGDNALSVPIGNIDSEVERLLAATEASLHAAIEFARDGELLGNLCASVEETILPFGYTVHDANWFAADGIPILPIDDAGNENAYPLMRVQAVSKGGNPSNPDDVLASVDVVLPVASEADCQGCHAAAGVSVPE